jgi:DNA-binding transcriptional ArsR family regulator
MKNEFKIDTEAIKTARSIIKTPFHKDSYRILRLLHKQGEMKVTPIYKTLRLQQSITSLYLANLRKYGLVKANKVSREVYYSINYDQLKKIHSIAAELITEK